MKQSGKFFKLNSVLTLFGLVLLMLFSPCKVTDFFQSGPDGAKTQLLNKKVSAHSNAACQSFDSSDAVATHANVDILHAEIPLLPAFRYKQQTFFVKETIILKPAASSFAAGVPLYILYRNLRVYS